MIIIAVKIHIIAPIQSKLLTAYQVITAKLLSQIETFEVIKYYVKKRILPQSNQDTKSVVRCRSSVVRRLSPFCLVPSALFFYVF